MGLIHRFVRMGWWQFVVFLWPWRVHKCPNKR
jgi:hypothetical protein